MSAQDVKKNNINVFDIGDIYKYQLSKYVCKIAPKIEDIDNIEEKLISFKDLYEHILKNVPNSRIIVIGGSDEICLSAYKSKLFSHIIHIDSQIDVKSKFKF